MVNKYYFLNSFKLAFATESNTQQAQKISFENIFKKDVQTTFVFCHCQDPSHLDIWPWGFENQGNNHIIGQNLGSPLHEQKQT